jgi:hypothetical protein
MKKLLITSLVVVLIVAGAAWAQSTSKPAQTPAPANPTVSVPQAGGGPQLGAGPRAGAGPMRAGPRDGTGYGARQAGRRASCPNCTGGAGCRQGNRGVGTFGGGRGRGRR